MANLGTSFDASQVAPPSFDLLPKGDYLARIIESDKVRNGKDTGDLLKLTLEIVEGQYAGKKLFDQINLSNPNDIAVKIGQERLSAYCHATGVMVVQDSSQLHNIPFMARVVIKVDKSGEYDDRNEIRSIKKLDAQSMGNNGFDGGGFNNSQGYGYADPNQGGFNNQQNNQNFNGQQNQNFNGQNQNFNGQNQNFGNNQQSNQNQGYAGYANNGNGQNQQQGNNQQQNQNFNGQQQSNGGNANGYQNVNGQNNQVVDTSPVAPMDGFNNQQNNQQQNNQQQNGYQNNNQQQQNFDQNNGQNQQQNNQQQQQQNNQQQTGEKAPWEQ